MTMKSSLTRLLILASLITPVAFSRTTPGYQQFRLSSAGSSGGNNFGDAVAATEDTVVVGAFRASVGGAKTGTAYVFIKPADGWRNMTETAELTASDGIAGAEFGSS